MIVAVVRTGIKYKPQVGYNTNKYRLYIFIYIATNCSVVTNTYSFRVLCKPSSSRTLLIRAVNQNTLLGESVTVWGYRFQRCTPTQSRVTFWWSSPVTNCLKKRLEGECLLSVAISALLYSMINYGYYLTTVLRYIAVIGSEMEPISFAQRPKDSLSFMNAGAPDLRNSWTLCLPRTQMRNYSYHYLISEWQDQSSWSYCLHQGNTQAKA